MIQTKQQYAAEGAGAASHLAVPASTARMLQLTDSRIEMRKFKKYFFRIEGKPDIAYITDNPLALARFASYMTGKRVIYYEKNDEQIIDYVHAEACQLFLLKKLKQL